MLLTLGATVGTSVGEDVICIGFDTVSVYGVPLALTLVLSDVAKEPSIADVVNNPKTLFELKA